MNTKPAAVLHKVLVLDDNPIIQRAVYFTLRDKGCQVFMCGNVTAALTLIRAEHPQLIVLDINFPPEGSLGGDRDGFWALDWMQRNEGIKDIPVIMISSDDVATARPRALAAGAAAFLQKPINKDELTALAFELLAKKSAATEPGCI